MILNLSPSIKVQIKYVFQRGDTLYWQRRVPKDLKERYGNAPLLKVNLKTNDLNRAAKMVERLNQQHEAQWEAMRGNKALTPAIIRDQALLLLKQHGLAPLPAENHPDTVEHFIETTFEEKRTRLAKASEEPEETYRELIPEDYATPAEVKALELLTTKPKTLLSDLPAIYLKNHKKGESSDRLVTDTNRVIDALIAQCGDIPFMDFTRKEAIAYRDNEITRGVKTGTVRRRIKTASAIFNKVLTELEITDKANPFKSIQIVGEGEDAEERETLTTEDLKSLQQQCKDKDDDIRHLIALCTDLGGRIGEATGLALTDICLDAEIPYISISQDKKRGRTLKKDEASEGVIPLVGASLWAAQRIVAKAAKGQKYAFPRYCDDKEVRADSSSNAVNDWLDSSVRGFSKKYTTHCFRHTMNDRLRAVGCPKEIRDQIFRWGGQDMNKNYGEGFTLKILKEWMEKVALKDNVATEASNT